METEKAKMEKSESIPYAGRLTPSSAFSFEADSLPVNIFNGSPKQYFFEFQRHTILKKREEMLIRYNNCFVCLQKAFAEVNLLQEENLKLRADNLDLSILVSEKENEVLSSISDDIVSDFQQIAINVGRETGRREASPAPQGSLENQNASEGTTAQTAAGSENPKRSCMPKVISVRSNGYLAVNKMKFAGGGPSSSKGVFNNGVNRPFRLRVASQEGKEESEGLELEVYNQGMLKTELCNKWEEAENCPYGERCQFAHGIEELRPVIRHPRYKTEICRMISSGGTCPYGHRCHFRHSLDPKGEKELVF